MNFIIFVCLLSVPGIATFKGILKVLNMVDAVDEFLFGNEQTCIKFPPGTSCQKHGVWGHLF